MTNVWKSSNRTFKNCFIESDKKSLKKIQIKLLRQVTTVILRSPYTKSLSLIIFGAVRVVENQKDFKRRNKFKDRRIHCVARKERITLSIVELILNIYYYNIETTHSHFITAVCSFWKVNKRRVAFNFKIQEFTGRRF